MAAFHMPIWPISRDSSDADGLLVVVDVELDRLRRTGRRSARPRRPSRRSARCGARPCLTTRSMECTFVRAGSRRPPGGWKCTSLGAGMPDRGRAERRQAARRDAVGPGEGAGEDQIRTTSKKKKKKKKKVEKGIATRLLAGSDLDGHAAGDRSPESTQPAAHRNLAVTGPLIRAGRCNRLARAGCVRPL